MYRLVFQSGRHEGKRIVVRQALTVAGRDPGCHLVLDGDERMAPRHASLEERGTGIYLSPLSPDHSVRRNGQPVTGAVRLAHNDEIDLGGIRLVFQELIAPQARLRPSSGLMQPVTILAAAAILAVEILLLAYLADWPAHLLRPAIESADLAFAEAHRAAKEAEAQALAKQKAETPAGAESIVSLPGTASASTSAPPVAVSTGPAPAVAAAPEEILQVLEVADFPPADTNTTLVDLPPVSAADPR
ncbi:MAG TPA: FHA domain-containing protein, partial [Kiritimatiellia bacterium]|nr:FHA domain-containing protein [Kiritimatiellia bacterium]